ncbi:RibD family protein [Luteolibacter ambystomatis]|uniref:RibD family protein n=1 Tax=Luteolibacter ambystomatis TaxID=2824561 RepID=A0A975J039_9BACT|nr:RibD family protein [Luteolibacter ambystomatis]QUE51555.1 RibD family protein [Luteolibacter ambystomatis]
MRPFVSTNLAISADGKISTVDRHPSGWTSSADHERLQAFRRGADALLVGRGTWEADRMTMTVRDQDRQPLRCVVSHGGNFDPSHPMFATPGGKIHLLVTGNVDAAIPSGAHLHHGSVASFLETLARDHGVQRLHCEGGGSLIRALAELDAIDEFHLTWAGHSLFGGKSAPTPTGIPGAFLPASLAFELTGFEPAAGECFLSYRRKRA